MKKHAVAAAAALLVAVVVSAQAPSGLFETLNKLNAAGDSGDKAAYAKFLTDDFTWVDRAGRLRNKTTMVEEIVTPTENRPTRTTPEVCSYENAAVLIGARRNPDGIQVKYLQAWVKNGNEWQMVAHQAVPASADQSVPPATKASSMLPASMGSQADRDAVQKNIETIAEGLRQGDGNLWATGVTDQVVSISVVGAVRGGRERMQEIKLDGPRPDFPTTGTKEASIRIHGNLAVVTQRIGGDPRGRGPAQGAGSWQTMVIVKDGGQWKRAAVISTLITGAARPATH